MTGKTHVACSVSATIAVSAITAGSLLTTTIAGTNYITPIMAMGSIFGALVVDIDIENSRMSNKVAAIQKVIRRACILLALVTVITTIIIFSLGGKNAILDATKLLAMSTAVVAILWVISINPHKYLKHRGATHALIVTLIVLGFALSLFQLANSLVVGIGLGMAFHLLADWFNKKGVPLLWPISNKHFHCPFITIKTGSKQEVLFMIVWVIICVLICYSYVDINILK